MGTLRQEHYRRDLGNLLTNLEPSRGTTKDSSSSPPSIELSVEHPNRSVGRRTTDSRRDKIALASSSRNIARKDSDHHDGVRTGC